VLLGMSMSGVPYVHSDAGGFAGGENDVELYIRWLQFAAYTPIFRPHGSFDKITGILPTEAALFDEPYKALAKKLIENRYALMPYNYTLAYNQSINGEPLISPLYYYFFKDTSVYAAVDEFMWGKSFLVAPVLQKGATTRNLYLPQGKWYSYKTFSVKQGGQWIIDPVTLDDIPVYVQEGSFIATNQSAIQNKNVYTTGELTITYFPSSKASSYTLYDDDGETKDPVKKNKYQLIEFKSNGWNGHTQISIVANTGIFYGKPNKRDLILCIPGLLEKPSSITINGKKIAGKMNNGIPYAEWDDVLKTLKLHLILANNPISIKIGA
jgi:oligosaccharide 4-alpha-D-glucosyltransferase